jgi:hypothetical protein
MGAKMIPIYRAKKIDSDEYVEGYYYPIRTPNSDITTPSIASPDLKDPEYDDYFEVDPSTLAIHFPDMIDSEGTKIFASLSEDGKGGDRVELSNYVQWSDEKVTKTAIYKEGLKHCFFHESFKPKVTGIQK